MLTLRTILHPTDFSPEAERAFQLACSLSRDHGSRLILLHVAPGREVLLGEFGMPPSPPEDDAALQQRLQSLHCDSPPIVVDRLLVQGEPAEQILAAARDSRCDLIVMGTHGRSGLPRLLMGSVAEAVLREAPCPVLIVKGHAPSDTGSQTAGAA